LFSTAFQCFLLSSIAFVIHFFNYLVRNASSISSDGTNTNQNNMETEFTEQLYQHQGIVHKICNLYFNNRLDKEDYKQEMIIQLWKAYPSFRNQSKFSTWMYRVCLNVAIDLKRKEKIQPQMVKLADMEVDRLIDQPNETESNKEMLYGAINRLSDIDKAIITLYLEDFSYREISEITGITETNTGVKINRIKSFIINYINHGNN